MSSQSIAGKRAWRHRAPVYANELREHVERESARRFARWQARGRLPMWLRIKQRVSAPGA